VALAVNAPALPAAADGEVAMRAAYYKERSTKVQQPMLDARLDVGDQGRLDAHLLVDVITSASVAAGREGSEFRELRYEHGTGYTHDLGRLRVGGGYRLSTEPDYVSGFVVGRGEIDFAQRNTTLGLGLAQGVDRFNNGNTSGLSEPVRGTLRTHLGSITLAQVLSRTLVASLTYDASYLRGDQENFYRQVSANGTRLLELVPDTRLRQAAFAQLRVLVPDTDSTVIVGYRYYRDDWRIRGHTPEVRIVQDLARGVHARLRYRYHRQTAAYFYREIYSLIDPNTDFRTDDAKLGAFTTHTVGGRLSSTLDRIGMQGAFAAATGSLIVEYLHQNNRFGDAVILQLALAVPLEY
jgi:hypothetical protein